MPARLEPSLLAEVFARHMFGLEFRSTSGAPKQRELPADRNASSKTLLVEPLIVVKGAACVVLAGHRGDEGRPGSKKGPVQRGTIRMIGMRVRNDLVGSVVPIPKSDPTARRDHDESRIESCGANLHRGRRRRGTGPRQVEVPDGIARGRSDQDRNTNGRPRD